MKNKIEFNWELYQTGEYDVVTRDGRKVEQLHKLDTSYEHYPIFGVIEGYVRSWANDGIYSTESSPMNNSDLFLIPKEKEDHIANAGEMVIPELKGVLMEVSDYKDFKVSCEEMVLGTYKGIFISDVGEWKYARPIKEVKECWVNVFYDGYMIISPAYSSKEKALVYKNTNYGYIKTIKITNEKECNEQST